jgi:CRP-like cAMP-binding protein
MSNLKRLMPELERISCPRELVLLDADSPLEHVFLPDSGVISVVAVYADGSIIEMATIGREGCAPVSAAFGAKNSSVRLLVQIPGSAAKISRAAFTRAMGSIPPFRNLILSYVQAFIEQVQVSAACNGAHNLKERLARWLLMMRDDAWSPEAEHHECRSGAGRCRLDRAPPTPGHDLGSQGSR